MAAVKGDRHRAASQQAIETGQASILVREHERRHRLAQRRRLHSGAVGRKTRDQLIDRGCIVRNERPDRPRIGFEPLAERGIHISTSKKDFAERCKGRGRHEGCIASDIGAFARDVMLDLPRRAKSQVRQAAMIDPQGWNSPICDRPNSAFGSIEAIRLLPRPTLPAAGAAMAISYVNGYLCTCSCDVSKAKRGEDPHPSTDPTRPTPRRRMRQAAMRGPMDQPSSTAAH